jgi:hypothetical protein
LEPLRLEKQNQMHSKYWQNIRDQAQRLFESLNSRLYPCTCQHPHNAKLRLDVRRSDSGEEAVRFTFLLTFEKLKCGTGKFLWDWRDIEIEVLVTHEHLRLSLLLNLLMAEQFEFEFDATCEICDDNNTGAPIHHRLISVINDCHIIRAFRSYIKD